jgi:NTE family protein
MENLILSGGAFKAAAFIGCLSYLEETDKLKDIRNVISSSAGAIIGFLFCAGLTMKQVTQFMKKGMHAYLEKEIEIDEILDVFDSLGIDDGKIFSDLASEILMTKFKTKDITFIEFAKATGKNLVILGSNISLAKTEYFSVNDTPNMSVVKALRISISIPFVMKPVIMNDMLYIDASLFNNFPIEYFEDKRNSPFQDTIALSLYCPMAVPEVNNINIFKYIHILFLLFRFYNIIIHI